ncbi:hypothetical protein IWQ56_002507, partial [Coemansia nantahalensis]
GDGQAGRDLGAHGRGARAGRERHDGAAHVAGAQAERERHDGASDVAPSRGCGGRRRRHGHRM